jgi:pyruvate/2-oxoglutarate dehydrogenase complex dihydrolipoamide dehydrogenase (E3) component
VQLVRKADDSAVQAAPFVIAKVVGPALNARETEDEEIIFEVTRYELAELGRLITEDVRRGRVKLLTVPDKERFLDAAIVGARAGELLAEFTLIMTRGLEKIFGIFHTYPTWADANHHAAGKSHKAYIPKAALHWAERSFRWRRQ